MILMYKLPTGSNIEDIKLLQGTEGTFLNPVQDDNGDWFLSQQECSSSEFNDLKTQYIDIVLAMPLVEYVKTNTPPI